MGKWGMRYANEGMTDKVNTASGLVRDFAGRLNTDELPSGNTSIQINLADVEKTPAGYIHVRDGQVQVCDTDLGFETDVIIDSTLDLMTRVWYGEIDMGKAVQSGRMNVSARPLYCRHLTRWLRISSFTTDNPSFGD
jgi:hypothetical protein